MSRRTPYDYVAVNDFEELIEDLVESKYIAGLYLSQDKTEMIKHVRTINGSVVEYYRVNCNSDVTTFNGKTYRLSTVLKRSF